MTECWSRKLPWVRTVFHSFLTILAPFVPIFHDFHVAASLNGVARLPHSFRSFPSRLVGSKRDQRHVKAL